MKIRNAYITTLVIHVVALIPFLFAISFQPKDLVDIVVRGIVGWVVLLLIAANFIISLFFSLYLYSTNKDLLKKRERNLSIILYFVVANTVAYIWLLYVLIG